VLNMTLGAPVYDFIIYKGKDCSDMSLCNHLCDGTPRFETWHCRNCVRDLTKGP